MSSPFRTVSNWSSEDLCSQYEEAERLDSSPHLLGCQKSPPSNSRQQYPLDTSRAAATVGWTSPPGSAKFQAPKRNRSPPMLSTNIPVGVSYPADMNSDREMQAKAKRLARFHVELNQPAENPSDFSKKSSLGSENNQVELNKVKFPVGDSTKKTGDSFDGGALSDYEGLEPYSAIRGLCPDMCPEPERGERERKGDLDKYERLDGERNQTSVSLAVKKYTRTAERDADLIRPLPVLQRTVDYLLELLNQAYDERFLGLYNFLWDRMRAIRMDLRMQHIFNHDAIRMLEQMIRLHIIAMHELSEHKKGEGFSEGFDAHLNIEQMNKTSVELFQMYDDHRKRGIVIPTEKEFRGYYALLKLDKHPGYKVEPAELSLDLAKMTPEVRCTSEILFARDVARACRTSNFVAFFRHARKATYLQACLMHAHFSKLRTQALASLHGGLQNNQGIPVSHVVKWLAMEGEDFESLLQYHGFSIRRFEEPYMVKEGPFLNSDVDYLTKCSQLVKLKRSKRIVDDVRHDQILLSPDKEQKSLSHITDAFEHGNVKNDATEAHFQAAADDKMLDYEVDYPSSRFLPPQAFLKSDIQDEMRDVHVSKMLDVAVDEPLYRHPLPSGSGMHFEVHRDGLSNEIVAFHVDENVLQVEEPRKIELVPAMENSLDDQALSSYEDGEQLAQTLNENEAARARLKLILRIWKRRSLRKREIRERRQSLADAALSLLPLGPLLRQNEVPNLASGSLNIDYVVRERHVRHEKSWSTLNVSAVVAPILSTRNHLAKCLLWKLVLCLQTDDMGNKRYQLFLAWLRRKMMGTGRENNDEHVIYSSNLSIWKKPLDNQVEVDFLHLSPACKLAKPTVRPTNGHNQELPDSCYSVVREVNFNNHMPITEDGAMVGLSAVIFLISESIPWVTQKVRLNKVISLIPSGSSLPLLILSSDTQRSSDDFSTIVSSLGLQHLDKMIVSDYSIVFIDGNDRLDSMNCFFSDDRLEGGLQWLAENSPLQPCPRQVKTRDLILTFLNSSLYALMDVRISDMGPDYCIKLFNEALDHSIEEIRFAAESNRNCWPGPEVDLLKDLPYVLSVVNMLPSRDWSSAARIEPLIAAIGSCKLPNFPDGLSWLSRGFDGGSDITNQKLALEQCLCSYLTHTVGLVGGNLAAREACVMIQKGTGLELHGKQYYIIPRWVEIFRRIYHWRLMSLSSGKFTLAYVLERGITGLFEWQPSVELRRHSLTDLEMVDLEETPATQQLHQLHSTLAQLSLDELIEMSCSVPPIGQPKLVSKLGQASETSFVGDLNISEGHYKYNGEDLTGSEALCQDLSSYAEQNEDTRYADIRQRVDKLNALLEKCNRQQNVNSEKLAIYF